MYLNIFYERPQEEFGAGFIHIWDDQYGYKKVPFSRYAYKINEDGAFKTLYGQNAKKVKRWSKKDKEAGIMYEADVNPEMRYLIDNYLDNETPSTNHIEMFFDIEVDSVNGLPNLETADKSITAISYYDKISKKYVALILDPSGEIEDSVEHKNGEDITVFAYGTEEDLLQKFMEEYKTIQPTIVTGWNIDNFDIPYLYRRYKVLFGEAYANELSPVGMVNWNPRRERYFLAGVSCLDYMSLYKTFTFNERTSYSLDAIGKAEVGMGKVVYEGSLDRLYKEDKAKYIEYNIHDVRIVVKIDEKMKTIDLAKGVVHKGHVPLEDIYFPSRYLDGAMLVYIKRKGFVAQSKPEYEHGSGDWSDKFAGAFVKEPIPGKYYWVVDLDATSLYPSIIMTLNISPETKVTSVQGWNNADFVQGKPGTYRVDYNDKTLTFNHDELGDFLTKSGMAISSNGILYDKRVKGIIPEILEKWFDERTEYKNLMKKHANEENKELYEYFNNRQYIQKVILNSFYGCLGLPSFRFYDKQNAESVTYTGVDLIKFASRVVNNFFCQALADTTGANDYIIYIDTDSLFMSLEQLVKQQYPLVDMKDTKAVSEAILEITGRIQKYVNTSMDYFAKEFLHTSTHRFNFKQEVIAKSAFWTTKKRYALDIINREGRMMQEIEVKGLDVVRTSFPKVFKDFMTDLLKDILNDVSKEEIDTKILDLKKNIKSFRVADIARPTGVKDITKYSDGTGQPFVSKKKGTPAHVKAAINYNDYLRHKGLGLKYAKISDGQKIKWVYLGENPFHIEEIAFKDNGEDPKEILEFAETYVDREKIYESEMGNKLIDFYSALNWGALPTSINVNSFKFF